MNYFDEKDAVRAPEPRCGVRMPLTAVLLTALAVSACSSTSSSADSTTYTLESSACTLKSSLSVSDRPSVQWAGCRMHYDADAHVVTWQLLPSGGGGGSLISPGADVVVLSFDGNALENTTFPLANVVSPLPASVPVSQTVFAYGTAGGRAGGTGTADIGSNVVYTNGLGGDLSGSLSIKLTSGATLTGEFSASARKSEAASSGGGSSGGGGGASGSCSDNGASCSSTGNAANGGQRASYCAAAVTLACFIAHGCYVEAGAATKVTRSQLSKGCNDANANARALGGGDCTACP